MASYWSPIIIIASVVLINLSGAQKYKICTTPRNLNACEQLNRTDDLKCFLRNNAVDCLLMVDSGEATIVSVTAEEAFLATPLASNLVVLGEFIDQNSRQPAEFETAVVVRKDIFSDMNSLKSTKYCQTDIGQTQISPFIEEEFEMALISQNNIDVCPEEINEKSITEYYVKALNDFLGPSCRSGQWTIANSTLDQELKQKYSKLLEICPSITNDDSTLYSSSIKCLIGGGDVAFTSISAINNYIIESPDFVSNYSLLCKNGSLVNITDKCSWTRQPWPLLVGTNNSITDLPQELTNWFSQQLFLPKQPLNENDLALADKHVQNLKEIIFPGPSHLINVTYDTPNLSRYIAAFRTIPTTDHSRLCKSRSRDLGLCLASTQEAQKFRWLQQASLNYGIQPILTGYFMTSKLECLKGVQDDIADIFVVGPNLIYTASQLNLSIIAFGEENKDHMVKTALIVKTATIQSLKDLEGKRGFFAGYGDIAWLSLANTLRKNLWNNSISYAAGLSSFLGESCMPGVKEADYDRHAVLADKMCALCTSDQSLSSSSANCNADSSNMCYGDDGALECLNYTGDFAVIAVKENMLVLPNGTNIMCKNGSMSITNTFHIDDECALSVTTSDYIIVNKYNPKIKNIEMTLKELDKNFATQLHTPFRIYDQFGGVKDLIFKDTTEGIQLASTATNKDIKDQLEIFNNIPGVSTSEKMKRSSAAIYTESLLILFTLLSFLFVT